MSRASRIGAVTLALMAAGFLAGTAAGSFPFLVIEAARAGTGHSVNLWPALIIGAGVGGFFGIVLGPTVMWEELSHVPVGRAIGRCFLGAVLGECVGLLLLPGVFIPVIGGVFTLMPPIGALAGFYWAVSRLARTAQATDGTPASSVGMPSNVRCS